MKDFGGYSWEFWLTSPTGHRIRPLNNVVSASTTRVLNGIGDHQILLLGDFDERLFGLDYMIEYWRAPQGGALQWVNVGFIRRWRFYEDEDGNDFVELAGPDRNGILNTRIVAYAAGSDEATKLDFADDMMKAVIRENMGSLATDTARDLSAYSFTVSGDAGKGPSVLKSFSRKKVITALEEIAASSRNAGTEVYFDIVPIVVSPIKIGFEFRTYPFQPGMDRTKESGNPLYFSKEWGNLFDVEYLEDHEEEENFIYVGGGGVEDDRIIKTASDDYRIELSPWNRREGFVDARNEDEAGAEEKANEAIAERRPFRSFSGTARDTDHARFGLDWNLGYRVEAEYRSREFSALINAVTFDLNDDSSEEISGRMEVSV